MSDLFPDTVFDPPFMLKHAVISDCLLYRYEARRIWDTTKPILVVCMLNPSRADASINDPTVLALIHFGKLWGYGGLLIVNLYAFRASKPQEMFAQGRKAFGPDNENYIKAAIEYAAANGGKMLVAWGNDGHVGGYYTYVALLAQEKKVDLVCLGKTNSGQPKHPMARGKHRIPRDRMPIIWRAAA